MLWKCFHMHSVSVRTKFMRATFSGMPFVTQLHSLTVISVFLFSNCSKKSYLQTILVRRCRCHCVCPLACSHHRLAYHTETWWTISWWVKSSLWSLIGETNYNNSTRMSSKSFENQHDYFLTLLSESAAHQPFLYFD